MWIALAFGLLVVLALLVASLAPFVSRAAPLCAGERRVLAQFVSMLVGPHGVDEAHALAAIERYLHGLPRVARAGFRLGLWLLDQAPRITLTSWTRFSALDTVDAHRAHARMAEHRIVVFGQLLEAVHLTVFMCTGNDVTKLDRSARIAKKLAAYEAAR